MAYYTALQLPRNATAEEIKRAYRKLALAAHPERATSTDSADVEDNFNLIAEAYDVLSHPARALDIRPVRRERTERGRARRQR